VTRSAVGYAWTMKHFPKKELAYAVVFVALLAGLYVGSYYALIVPRFTFVVPIMGAAHWEGATMFQPDYRFGGDTAKAVFAPWHQVDLRIRPGAWRWRPRAR
jgi:hypothetical protein